MDGRCANPDLQQERTEPEAAIQFTIHLQLIVTRVMRKVP